MNIPDEAVEAAAFELYKDDHWGAPTAWPDGPFADGLTLDEFKSDYRRLARTTLEAAAPHLAVAAHWDHHLDTAIDHAAKEWHGAGS